MTDLVALTSDLINFPSESYHEKAFADYLEARLQRVPWLQVDRFEDNVVARTNLGRQQRLLLVGHSDTVPANNNTVARLEDGALWGLGASDMKGGLAVNLWIAEQVADPVMDLTFVFYACEEVAAADSGLEALLVAHPDWLAGDAAIVGEPTDGVIEAGCQGTMRLRVSLTGVRSHSARPWMGRNALHRAGHLLTAVDAFEERRPVIDGCEYREALQAVSASSGVSANVIPDRAEVVINHRFAPDRTPSEAEAMVRELFAPVLEPGDIVEVIDVAPGALPNLGHRLFAPLVARLEVRSKLGWTDVARLASRGIPALNLGPGDPLLAHHPDERVEVAALRRTGALVHALVTGQPLP